MDDKYKIKLRDIQMYEPKKLCLNINNISEPRINELISNANQLMYSFTYFRKNLTNNKRIIITHIDKYSFICRTLFNTNNILKLYSQEIEFNSEEEKELFIVLCTDPELKYLEYYNRIKIHHNNLEIKNKFYNDFGFYSSNLLRMELHAYKLFEKLKKERGNNNEINTTISKTI